MYSNDVMLVPAGAEPGQFGVGSLERVSLPCEDSRSKRINRALKHDMSSLQLPYL